MGSSITIPVHESRSEKLLLEAEVGRLLRPEDVHHDAALAAHALLQLVELLEQGRPELEHNPLGRRKRHSAAQVPFIFVHNVPEEHAGGAGVAHDAEDEGALFNLRGLLDVVRDVPKS